MSENIGKRDNDGRDDLPIVVDDLEPVKLERVHEAQARKWVAVLLTATLCVGTILTIIASAFLGANPTGMVAAMAPLAGAVGAVANRLFPVQTV